MSTSLDTTKCFCFSSLILGFGGSFIMESTNCFQVALCLTSQDVARSSLLSLIESVLFPMLWQATPQTTGQDSADFL